VVENAQRVSHSAFSSPEAVGAELAARDYFPEPALASAVFLTRRLELPLFLEGDPGAGKTAPVRLQCYAGIDRAQAPYEWDFAKQLLSMRGAGDSSSVCTADFLITRPARRRCAACPACNPKWSWAAAS